MGQEIKLRKIYKDDLVRQGYSLTAVVSVLRSFLLDARTWAMANGGQSNEEILFGAFRSAEGEWRNFCLEISGQVTMDDFHHELSQFCLRHTEWRKWRDKNPLEEGPMQ